MTKSNLTPFRLTLPPHLAAKLQAMAEAEAAPGEQPNRSAVVARLISEAPEPAKPKRARKAIDNLRDIERIVYLARRERPEPTYAEILARPEVQALRRGDHTKRSGEAPIATVVALRKAYLTALRKMGEAT